MADRVLVTGGAGFIGCRLVRALVERGDRVTVVDDFSRGRRDGALTTLLPDVEFVEHDLTMPLPEARLGDGYRAVVPPRRGRRRAPHQRGAVPRAAHEPAYDDQRRRLVRPPSTRDTLLELDERGRRRRRSPRARRLPAARKRAGRVPGTVPAAHVVRGQQARERADGRPRRHRRARAGPRRALPQRVRPTDGIRARDPRARVPRPRRPRPVPGVRRRIRRGRSATSTTRCGRRCSSRTCRTTTPSS